MTMPSSEYCTGESRSKVLGSTEQAQAENIRIPYTVNEKDYKEARIHECTGELPNLLLLLIRHTEHQQVFIFEVMACHGCRVRQHFARV